MRIMSEASLVTSVPAIPIENPTLASLEGEAIVCTVTGDTNDFTERVEGFNENLLVLRGRPGQDLETLVRVESAENGTLHDDTTGGVDAAPSGDQASSEDVVSGTHPDGCTCVVAAGDNFADTRTKEVFNTGDGHQSHVAGEII